MSGIFSCLFLIKSLVICCKMVQASHPVHDSSWRPYTVLAGLRVEELQDLLDSITIFKARSLPATEEHQGSTAACF